ncbi:MAG: hypothetical protein HDT14_07680 [Oscillibacter sp.]|nr:hypothetical protein [Oscillibacter sp.]
MHKKRMTYVTMGFGVLLVVVMVLLAWGGRRQSGGIVLPESLSDSAGMEGNGQDSQLDRIEITPETVRSAIGALPRPAAYRRAQTVETFWSGGSGQSVTQVYVSGSRTRLDAALPDGSVRHTLIEAARERTLAGVWYDDETDWVELESDELTADQAGRMLSYETVRDLPVDAIAQADYREAFGASCIYVETRPDEDGYQDRYWVNAHNGLLMEAERLWKDEVIYRFSAGEPEIAPQEESLFRLPDGDALGEPALPPDAA